MSKNEHIKIKFATLTAAIAAVLIFTTAYSEKFPGFVNLTMRINTEGDDYAPSVTSDGNTAVFNSRMPEEKSHNIFICHNKNGFWGDPYPIFEINSDSNEETPFISADGKTILFASDRPGGFSPPRTSDGKKRITFDIYITHLVNGKWTSPVLLKGTVNTNMNERAPGLSSEGKTLVFTRWPYNYPGKSKIYAAKLEDGGFTRVKKLPPSINTGNFEIGLRPSYKTGKYYYASRKPGGSGGWDIYYTTLKGRKFKKPVNAGESINTPYDDMYYTESKINTMISSDRAGGFGKFDLYTSVPAEKSMLSTEKNESSSKPASILHITAIDREDKKPVKNNSFTVHIMGEREKESVLLRKTKIKSDSSGSFTLTPKDDADSLLIEPVSKKYNGNRIKINIARGQYQDIAIYLEKKSSSSSSSSDNKGQELSNKTESSPSFEENESEKSGMPLLNAVYFKFNSSEIPTEYIPEIHILVAFLRDNPEYRITITGYSDPSGSIRSNDKLSMNRAKNVADYIRSLEISDSRIKVEWHGELKSVSEKNGSRYSGIDRKVELLLKKIE